MLLAIRLGEDATAVAIGIGFSAGIMLQVPLVELGPESIGILGTGSTTLSFALGAGIVDQRLVRSAYLIAFGLILHDVPEGFAIANACVSSPELDVLVAITSRYRMPVQFATGMILSMCVYALLARIV